MRIRGFVNAVFRITFLMLIVIGVTVAKVRERLAAIMDSPWFWVMAVVLAVLAAVFVAGIIRRYFSNGGGNVRGRM